MAAPPPSIAVEDQTDEDFFDKLVEDDFVAQPATVARAFSSLSVGDSELASGVDVPLGNYIKGASVSEEKTTAPTAGPLTESVLEVDSKGGGTKGTSVKVVQWSAFHVEPQQSDNGSFGFDADFYTENNGGRSVNKQQENVAFDSCFAEQPVSSDLSSSAFVSSSDQQDAQHYGLADEQNTDWENLYPGWKYDYATGQWYQVDGYNANMDVVQSDSYGSVSESTEKSSEDKVHAASDSDRFISGSSGVSYLQQTTHSVLGTIAEESTTSSADNWNQDSQGVMQYPSNMLFDPQYPGWYYDTNTQKWYTLESYTQSAIQNTATTLQDHSSSYESALGEFTAQQNYSLYNEVSQFEQQTAEGQGSQDIGGDLSTSTGNFAQGNWNTSMGSYVQGDWNMYMNNFAPQNMRKSESVDKSSHAAVFYENQQSGSFYGSAGNTGRQMDQHIGFRTSEPVSSHGYGTSTALNGIQGFVPHENTYHFNQPKVEQSIQTHSVRTGYGHESSINYSQPTFQGRTASYSQFPHASNEGRSSAGRSPHALVTFGFGGKLIVMKDASSLGTKLDYGRQGTVGGTVSVLNLVDIVMDKSDGSSIINNDSCGYFHALCQQSFPGPLVGGNPATKDVNKWLDERIMNCESSSMDFRKGEHLKLLFCLLKILYQHYGKLRSPFGADPSLEETDGPEAAITKLFASAGKSGAHLMEYDSFTHCMKNLPSEGQVQATTIKVQSLLVSGRRQEAIKCAQDGHMWGPALVLAAQFGEKFYIETVKKMACQQFISGSPLRTLCLLIAGQPADVFSADSSTNSLAGSTFVNQNSTQVLNNGMLNSWEENLAIITANRTKDDELVIIHLGDCLWKERGAITAAHTCYLVAEANFESYSDSARLCLIGADHWKCPRTYASPEAIQRTELYEYSKVLGNSQFILLPFQPYKFLYASMLAEVGKVSDSLRYCQASLKSLKYSSRAPEVETWKSLFSSLEERLRTHQQGGYGTNLAPSKLVGKFFTSIDRSIHRMIGAPLPPLPPLSHSNVNGKESFPVEPKVASSQSTMAMSSLIPSASVEAMNEWTGDSNRKAMHNRSISEPDFGRSPKQASTKDSGSADSQGKASGGPSRFGRFGSQLLQKTMNWVSKSHPDRQAKLGERNKFYYDEKLKRWVEEGTGPPAEEASLPPPPTSASFQSGAADYNINNAFKRHNVSTIGGPETNGSEQSSGIPPIPPSTNQFSAHARMGVWSRYVDTFNKGGGGVTKSFQSLSVPSVKSPGPASFFIPTVPTASDLQPVDEPQEHIEEAATTGEPSTSIAKESLFTSPSSSSSWSMQRFPSMDNIVPLGNKKMGAPQNANGSLSSRTRAASWSGVYTEKINPVADGKGGSRPFASHDLSQLQTSNSSLQLNSSCLGDDLHEVDL